MLKHLGRFVGAAILAVALLAAPKAFATDLSLDGQLRGQCGTATAASSAATLNNKCGTITTEALTTGVGSNYTLTLTNSAIAAADLLMVEVSNGTNTKGGPTVQTVVPAAGSAVITILNNPTGTGSSGTVAPFNGTLQVKYFNIKP